MNDYTDVAFCKDILNTIREHLNTCMLSCDATDHIDAAVAYRHAVAEIDTVLSVMSIFTK